MVEQYCIKSEYRCNNRAVTFDEDKANAYWNDQRIEAAIHYHYQYYVYKKALSLFLSKGYKSLLDVGCGLPLKIKWLFAPHCNDIVLIDQPSLTQLAQQIVPKYRFIPSNLEHINFELSKKFDLIICSDVLEHLLNPDNCAAFIRRHSALNGLVIFSTPERDYLRGNECNYSPKNEHVREWNSIEFGHYLKNHGFRIIEQLQVPQIKLRSIEFLSSRILPQRVWSRVQYLRRRWGSCQVVICKSD